MAVQARTALRRGAPLLKYCRLSKPHVAQFQLSSDETKLEWVGKGAKTKHVSLGLVCDVLHGRESNLFKRATSQHPPALCLSVIYYESEREKKRSAGGKGSRSLDLVCATVSQAQMWVHGLRAVRERLTMNYGRHAAGRSPAETFATAMAVGKAAGKFKRALSTTQYQAGGSFASVDAAGTEPIREPGDLLLWGRIPSSMTLGHRGTRHPAGSADSAAAAAAPLALLAPEGRWVEWLTPTTVPGTEGLDVVRVSVGSRHAAAVVRHQGVYTWGDGAGGRLGNGTALSCAEPAKLFALGGGGGGGAEGVGRSGGRDRSGGGDCPGLEQRSFPGSMVGADDVRLCCGGSYTVALTAAPRDDVDGGSGGCSAGGDEESISDNAGAGRCFVWGDGGRGSPGVLGRGGGGVGGSGRAGGVDTVAWMPIRISGSLESRRVSMVSCGSFHAAAVCDSDGACFTWGEGAFHALGHGTRASELSPRRVEGDFAGRRVLRVSCGVWHTAATVALVTPSCGVTGAGTDASAGSGGAGNAGGGGDIGRGKAGGARGAGEVGGELWTWGDADGGKLGLGDIGKDSATSPRRVVFPITQLVAGASLGGSAPVMVTRVSCGQWHTLALEGRAGALWVCGSVGRVGPSPAAEIPQLVPFPLAGVGARATAIEDVVSGGDSVTSAATRVAPARSQPLEMNAPPSGDASAEPELREPTFNVTARWSRSAFRP